MEKFGFLLVFVVAISALVGFVLNIVKLTGATFSPLEAETVLRTIGIFVPPLGAVLGFW